MVGAMPQPSEAAVKTTSPAIEDSPAAVTVSCGAPGEQQRAQRQEVAVEDPLLIGQARIQLPPDGRKRDVDHGAIQQSDPRTKDGRGNQPARTCRRQRQLTRLDRFTAGLLHG
jgi:hypothetical protein